jgi:hypothetical protein
VSGRERHPCPATEPQPVNRLTLDEVRHLTEHSRPGRPGRRQLFARVTMALVPRTAGSGRSSSLRVRWALLAVGHGASFVVEDQGRDR